jgi:hypothetical protein
MRSAIFHIKSDSATFDNIAMPSGNGSCSRVIAVDCIALPPFDARTANPARDVRSKNCALTLTD